MLAGDRGHIGQAHQPEHALDHRVIGVEARFAQAPETEQQVHHEQQHDAVQRIDRGGRAVPEAAAKPRHQARERGQCLFLESQGP